MPKKKNMEKSSPPLTIKEMQIKTKIRLYLTPIRVAIIKNTIKSKCWQGCRGKGTLIHCWLESKLVQLIWKTIWRLLQKLNIDLPYNPAIPLLGIFPRNVTQVIIKNTCTHVYCSTIHNSQLMERAKMPHYQQMA
jgi:hypothetical protein